MDELNKDPKEMNKDLLWRSVEEYKSGGKLDDVHYNEFMPGVKEEFDPQKMGSGISRRKFLALLSASAAFTAAGCSDYRDKGELMPYNKKPEEMTIGEANYYASTCSSCAHSCGILIKTREGRPIKVDGNPDHPVSAGKICAKGHASIMDLYDPQRFTEPQVSKEGIYDPISWKDVDNKVILALSTLGASEAAFISNKVSSPTAMKLMKELQEKFSGIKYYYYDLFSDVNRATAWRECYGEDSIPAVINWDQADVIVALETNLYGTDGNSVEQQRLITSRRSVTDTKKFNRIYAAEANFSSTGANADYRLRIKPTQYHDFVMTLINEVSKRGKGKGLVPKEIAGVLSGFSVETFAKKAGFAPKSVKALNSLVGDLLSTNGKTLVYAGETVPVEVHVLVNLLNEMTGGSSLYSDSVSNVELHKYSTAAEITDLISKMKSGKVKLLVNLDANPVYHLPKDSGFVAALKSVPLVVSLATLQNETTFASNFVLPLNHNFENWGDASVRSNVTSTMQPVIAPLYNTRQKEAILLQWLSGNAEGYKETAYLDYLKASWKESNEVTGSFDKFWSGIIHDGLKLETSNKTEDYKFTLEKVALKNPLNEAKFSVILAQSYALGDGKHANNGWLQELPHPISKVTWDNYAAISDKTSREIGVKTNSLVEVEVSGKKVTLPVLIQPGLADNTVVVELGYGRTKSPVVALEVGKDVSLFMKSLADRVFTNATVTPVDGKYILASTQDHHSYDETLVKDVKDAHLKRHIIQEGTVKQYEKNPEFLGKKHNLISLYDEHKYPDNKWGMTIDLNKCTGCGNCSVACSIENNIPVVGKDQVIIGREMQWMRIDRYYAGTPEEPVASYQPMMCQHCDNAPCENVCPVVATTHSIDGLNQMVYNRCVGTRYCSNNCPYKVRRFNFYDFRDHFAKGYYYEQPVNLGHNPEVSVRPRGVMEKCTFCVHRIEEERSKAVATGRKLKGSDVKTACQEACPADAISFGDLVEKDSEFKKFHDHNLAYHVLEELNVKPNISYIARLWNTNTEEV